MQLILALALLFLSDEEPSEKDPPGSETLPKYYSRVDGGRPLKKLIDHDGNGTFIQLVSLNSKSKDTLRVYVQGVVPEKVTPNVSKANEADLAVWCFPTKYPHQNHIFPNAKGQIYIHESQGKVTFVTREFADELDLNVHPV